MTHCATMRIIGQN